MALVIPPYARYMILCDEVLPDPDRPGKLMIVGLTSVVQWPVESTTPVQLDKLVVLLILTDGRGTGTGKIVCSNEETGARVFSSSPRPISFEGKYPTGQYGVVFKLIGCRFPEPGVYALRFLFEDAVVSEQVLIVR